MRSTRVAAGACVANDCPLRQGGTVETQIVLKCPLIVSRTIRHNRRKIKEKRVGQKSPGEERMDEAEAGASPPVNSRLADYRNKTTRRAAAGAGGGGLPWKPMTPRVLGQPGGLPLDRANGIDRERHRHLRTAARHRHEFPGQRARLPRADGSSRNPPSWRPPPTWRGSHATNGGFETSSSLPIMRAQVQVIGTDRSPTAPA